MGDEVAIRPEARGGNKWRCTIWVGGVVLETRPADRICIGWHGHRIMDFFGTDWHTKDTHYFLLLMYSCDIGGRS